MVADDAPVRAEQDQGTIVLAGEIDAYAEARVRETLTHGTDSGDLRVDVSGVTFMDSSGLRVMLEVHQRLTREGRRLVLVAPPRAVTRLIEVAGLVSHLHAEPPLDRPEAPQPIADTDR